MSCCDELFEDLANGNRQIASKSIKWDQAAIWGISTAVTTYLTGGSNVVVAGTGAVGGTAGAFDLEAFSALARGTSGLSPMTEEQWALALIHNSRDLWVGDHVATADQPFWAEGVEESWDEFWKTSEGLKLKSKYTNPALAHPIDGTGTDPSQWQFWMTFGDGYYGNGMIEPEGKREIGLAYLNHVYGPDMMRFIDLDSVDPEYINLLNYARNTMDSALLEKFPSSSPYEYIQAGETVMPSTSFETLVHNPMLLNLINSSFVEGGDFAELALQANNISQMNEQSPMFNMLLQATLDSEGYMKNILVDNIFSTEDGEGSNLFDQAVEKALHRAMGIDPELEVPSVTYGYPTDGNPGGAWTSEQKPLGEIMPHPMEQVNTNIASLKTELSTIDEKAKDAYRIASGLEKHTKDAVGIAKDAMRMAKQAMSVAERGLNRDDPRCLEGDC